MPLHDSTSGKQKKCDAVEFFFVITEDSKRYAKKAAYVDLPEGEGTAVFSAWAKQNQQRVDLGFHERSGERIEGWLFRAVKEERILGIATSAPTLRNAANP